MKINAILLALLVLPPLAGRAATYALDDASNYSSNWSDSSNGGSGFGSWTFQTSGNAGMFLATTGGNGDLNGIATSTKGFGTYANGGGFQSSVAYREFNGGSLSAGQNFLFSLENGNIQNSGTMGVTMRNGNANANIGDYNNASRFEFFFQGGAANYNLIDGAGTFDTGIGFTDGGLDVSVMLTGADSYNLSILRKSDSQVFNFNGRTFGGTTGQGLDSFALYNRDTENGNVYFNSLAVAPEPSRSALMMIGVLGLFMLRRRS